MNSCRTARQRVIDTRPSSILVRRGRRCGEESDIDTSTVWGTESGIYDWMVDRGKAIGRIDSQMVLAGQFACERASDRQPKRHGFRTNDSQHCGRVQVGGAEVVRGPDDGEATVGKHARQLALVVVDVFTMLGRPRDDHRATSRLQAGDHRTGARVTDHDVRRLDRGANLTRRHLLEVPTRQGRAVRVADLPGDCASFGNHPLYGVEHSTERESPGAANRDKYRSDARLHVLLHTVPAVENVAAILPTTAGPRGVL